MLFKVQTISHLKPVIVIKDHYIFHWIPVRYLLIKPFLPVCFSFNLLI
jgi:hypothetical protein